MGKVKRPWPPPVCFPPKTGRTPWEKQLSPSCAPPHPCPAHFKTNFLEGEGFGATSSNLGGPLPGYSGELSLISRGWTRPLACDVRTLPQESAFSWAPSAHFSLAKSSGKAEWRGLGSARQGLGQKKGELSPRPTQGSGPCSATPCRVLWKRGLGQMRDLSPTLLWSAGQGRWGGGQGGGAGVTSSPLATSRGGWGVG